MCIRDRVYTDRAAIGYGLAPIVLRFFVCTTVYFIATHYPVACIIDRNIAFGVQIISSRNDDTDILHIVYFIVLNGEVDHIACQCKGFTCAAMNFEDFTLLYQQVANWRVVIRT